MQKNAVGLPERPLFESAGRNNLAKDTAALGGSVIFSNHEAGKLRYKLGLVGIFLTSEGPKLELLMKRFMRYLKDRYDKDKDLEHFSSKELTASSDPLSDDELNKLRLILYSSHRSFAARWGGGNDIEWQIVVENDVVDLKHVPDWDALVKSEVMKQYDPQEPASESARLAYQAFDQQAAFFTPDVEQPSASEGVRISPRVDPRKIFVVHGRNVGARNAMFTFLRSIGLQPIEWSEAVSMTPGVSPYIGEVLEHAFGHAMAIVVLFTGDDEARLRPQYQASGDNTYETSLTPQARPNVLFEAGLAFGVHPERTILVELGRLRPFSDIGGRHVVRINNTTESRQNLAMRLQKAGCEINLQGTDWHSAGDFDAALPDEHANNPDQRLQGSKDELEPIHVKILTFLGRHDIGTSVPIEHIAADLQMNPQRALHYVEWLVENQYAYDILVMGSGARYGLDTRGRACLVAKGLL